MAVNIGFPTTSGRSLVATLQRVSDGYFWNEAAGAWQFSPSFANRSITLTEGSSQYAGLYVGANTGSLGAAQIRVFIHDASASNICIGIAETATDASGEELFLNSVDVARVLGTVPTALERSIRCIAYGTVGAAASTTSIPTSALTPAGAVLDQFKGRVLIFDKDTTTAALRGQASDITGSSNAATPTLTVTALTTAPASGDTFVIV